jgi:hypothetical protein
MTLMMAMVIIVVYSPGVAPVKWEWKDSTHAGAARPRPTMSKVLAHIHVTKCKEF